MKPISTRNQQVAQQSIELLNRLPEGTEESERIKTWFQGLGIALHTNEEMFGNRYSITQEQILQVAELELSVPDWFPEPCSPLQYAGIGFYVSFLLSTGRHMITTVIETRTISRGTTTLLGLGGSAQGWYSMEGLRTTKEGQPFQGSAYAGRIFPVDTEILLLIERQEILTTLTGYHQPYFSGKGWLHSASNDTLREIRFLLQERAAQVTAASNPAGS